MQFSFSSGSFPWYTVPAIFELGYLAGADAIELLLTPRLAAQGTERLRALERERRLPIASVHSIIRLRGGSLDQELEDLRTSASIVQELENCRSLVVHVPQSALRGGGLPHEWLRAVTSIQAELDQVGASVSLENPDIDPSTDGVISGSLFTQWRSLAQEFGFRTTLDTSHAAAARWNVLDLARQARLGLDNVHLSNIGGRHYRSGLLNSLLHAHRPPADGKLELERFLARLVQTDYSGLITLEISPLRVPWFRFSSAQRALAEMLLFCRRATGDVRSIQAHSPGMRSKRSRVGD